MATQYKRILSNLTDFRLFLLRTECMIAQTLGIKQIIELEDRQRHLQECQK